MIRRSSLSQLQLRPNASPGQPKFCSDMVAICSGEMTSSLAWGKNHNLFKPLTIPYCPSLEIALRLGMPPSLKLGKRLKELLSLPEFHIRSLRAAVAMWYQWMEKRGIINIPRRTEQTGKKPWDRPSLEFLLRVVAHSAWHLPRIQLLMRRKRC